MIVLWDECGNESLTLEKFCYCYVFRATNHCYGVFHFAKASALDRLILDLPSSNKNWMDRFFFVSGNNWEIDPSEPPGLRAIEIPRRWNVISIAGCPKPTSL